MVVVVGRGIFQLRLTIPRGPHRRGGGVAADNPHKLLCCTTFLHHRTHCALKAGRQASKGGGKTERWGAKLSRIRRLDLGVLTGVSTFITEDKGWNRSDNLCPKRELNQGTMRGDNKWETPVKLIANCLKKAEETIPMEELLCWPRANTMGNLENEIRQTSAAFPDTKRREN